MPHVLSRTRIHQTQNLETPNSLAMIRSQAVPAHDSSERRGGPPLPKFRVRLVFVTHLPICRGTWSSKEKQAYAYTLPTKIASHNHPRKRGANNPPPWELSLLGIGQTLCRYCFWRIYLFSVLADGRYNFHRPSIWYSSSKHRVPWSELYYHDDQAKKERPGRRRERENSLDKVFLFLWFRALSTPLSPPFLLHRH